MTQGTRLCLTRLARSTTILAFLVAQLPPPAWADLSTSSLRQTRQTETPRRATLEALVRVRSQYAERLELHGDLVGLAKRVVPQAFQEQRAFGIGKVGKAEASIDGFGQWSEETILALHELINRLSDVQGLAVQAGRAVLTVKGEKLTVDDPVVVAMASFVLQWAKAREPREKGEKVVDKEIVAAFADLVNTIWFFKTTIDSIEDPALKAYLSSQVRFVPLLEEAQPNTEEAALTAQFLGVEPPLHYEYGKATPWLVPGEGDVTSPGHAALAGYAGQHRGTPSIYTSVARTKRYAKLIALAQRTGFPDLVSQLQKGFRAWLIHQAQDLQAGEHADLAPHSEAAQLIQRAEELIAADYQQERAEAIQKLYDEDKNRFTETFIVVDLAEALGHPTKIPDQMLDVIEVNLNNKVVQKSINDFVVKRFGNLLIFDITHDGPMYHMPVQVLVAEAIRRALSSRAHELGLYRRREGELDLARAPLQALARALDWHTDDVRYTKGPSDKRKSQPTVRQFILGGDERAFNSILFNLYGSPDKTTMQPIEGSFGEYFVNQQLKGIKGDAFTRFVRGEQLDPGGRQQIVMHLPHQLFDQVNLNKGPDPDFGRDSAYVTKAIFAGKGSRFPADEPQAQVLNLGKIQIGVYQSQAGAEAVGGILGVAARDQTVDGVIDGVPSRLNLKPITWEEAETLTLDTLSGRKIAPTAFLGSQMNRGRFGEVLDVVQEAPEFTVKQSGLVQRVKGELNFEEIFQAHWPIQPGTNAIEAMQISAEAWKELRRRGETDSTLQAAGLQQAREIPDRRVLLDHWATANHPDNRDLSISIFKADIGSSLGHTIPPKLLMILIRTYLDYAKEQGWIVDYLIQKDIPMFRVGDDIEVLFTHRKGMDEREIHGVAWRAFYFALYFAYVANRDEYYGFAQDLPTDVDFFLQFARMDGEPDPQLRTFLFDRALEAVRTLSREDRHTITPVEIVRAAGDFHRKYTELQNGTYTSPQAGRVSIFEATGNTRGSGFGLAEFLKRIAAATKRLAKRTYTFFAFDKASPGAFSLPYYHAAKAALEAGDYDNLVFEIDVVKPNPEVGIEKQETMLVDFATNQDLILRALAAVNEFQIKAVWTREKDGSLSMVAVNSTERLYQSEKASGAYLGKDDPAAIIEQTFANHVINWLKKTPYIIQGDERGSHWKFALPVPATRSSPGTYSIPVVVSVSFTVGENGQLENVTDVFAQPEFELALARAVAGNELLIERNANDPRRGAIGDIEQAYPGRRKHRELLKAAEPALSVRQILANRGTATGTLPNGAAAVGAIQFTGDKTGPGVFSIQDLSVQTQLLQAL